MLTTTPDQIKKLKHGQKVKCNIDSSKIDDAKVSIDSNGEIFICQNIKDGCDADNKLGYKYSWTADSSVVTNLITVVDKTNLEDMEVGDILIDTYNNESKVLAICGQAFLTTSTNLIDASRGWYSFQEAKNKGCKFKDTPKEENLVKLTLEEIAKKLSIPVDTLRIKD